MMEWTKSSAQLVEETHFIATNPAGEVVGVNGQSSV